MTTASPWQAMVSVAELRRAPLPTQPPPGPLDGVVGLLLARAAPFDRRTQAALRRQQGWGPEPAMSIEEVRTSGRWRATPALARLTAATEPPASLLAALCLLETLTPCPAGDAAAALLDKLISESPMHPAGVLALARWYGLSTSLRLQTGPRSSWLVGPRDRATSQELHRVLSRLSRAGYARLDEVQDAIPGARRERRALLHALDETPRVVRDDQLVVRADDRASGLALHFQRMLYFSPRPLAVTELHDGLDRQWRYRRHLLPSPETLDKWIAAQS